MTRVLIVIGWMVLLIAPAAAQPSRCADCHVANPDATEERHLSDWERSAHSRNAVGCDACHGGNSGTFEAFLAHQGVLHSSNPASPVHHTNLSQTCGGCHIGPFVAFQDSRHYDLVRAGDENVPTCNTCHGDVGARLLSPQGLERQCARCHGAGQVAEHPEFPARARIMMEEIRDVRATLDAARRLIDKVRDPRRQVRLQQDYDVTEAPVIQAVQAGHRLDFDRIQEQVALAREGVVALFDRLLNSGGH